MAFRGAFWFSRRKAMVFRFIRRLLLVMCVMYAGGLAAQTSTGTITGQVVDGSGAVLPNAAVKLTLVANGTTRETKTNAEGTFSAPVIPPGVYAITVTAPGFSEK